MLFHSNLDEAALRSTIRRGVIILGGHKKLKIYGHLHCKSGKRMKRENRVFFSSIEEALAQGFRPCGHCMKKAYQNWKNELVQ